MIKPIILLAALIYSALSSTTGLAQQALSEQALQQIFANLSQTKILHAQFNQQKKLQHLNRNYLSSGEVCFAREYGILWRLQQPVRANLIVGQTKIVQQTANTHSEIALQKSPYASVASVFLEIMAGNQKQLEENFTLISAQQLNSERWAIAMTPRTDVFAQLFTQVRLEGTQHIEQIILDEASGTQTVLQFSQHRSNNSNISADEHALFSLAQ